MIVIGLTGSIGSGKSTVAQMFKALGAKVIDADKLVHALLTRRGPVQRQILNAFGPDIVTKGRLDRKKLGRIVFGDPCRRQWLERVLHPLVIRDIRLAIQQARKTRRGCLLLDVPLLFECDLYRDTDWNVVVRANRTLQIDRTRKRLGLSRGEIQRRIASQLPPAKKMALADVVIDNRGSKTETWKQVQTIWNNIIKKDAGLCKARNRTPPK